MLKRPDEDVPPRPAREVTFEQLQRADREGRRLLTVRRVKVGHAVVQEIHVNHDAKKAADGGHWKNNST